MATSYKVLAQAAPAVPVPPINITDISNTSGTFWIVTTASAHGFSVGDSVTFADVSAAGWDGVFEVYAEAGATQFIVINDSEDAMAGSGATDGNVSIPASTDLYTVPAATQSVISTIVIANRSGTTGTFRLAVRPNGATLSDEHFLAYDVPLAANDSTTLTLGITMGAADVLTISDPSVEMSVNVFGSEIS